jgi:SAM-dependent methyltransferase
MTVINVDSDLKKTYNEYYQSGTESEWRKLGAVDKAKNIISACSKIPHDKVLEIGAGEGALLQELSNHNFGNELSALEISESGAESISKRNIKNLKEVKLYDGYVVPFVDDEFDVVILSHVVEHLEHPRILISEAARVSKHLFIEVPLEDVLTAPKDFKITRTGHINFYSYKGIRKLAQSVDLDCLNQEISNPSFAVHKYLYNNKIKAVVKYSIRKLMLRFFPKMASYIFVYHCHLLLKSKPVARNF